MTTLYDFQYANDVDGGNPVAALLVGRDGATLYGTTEFGGANGGGTLFSIVGTTMNVLYAFDSNESPAESSCYFPMGALIFGEDGRLYGTTYSGGSAGCIFSLNIDGSGYALLHLFSPPTGPVAPAFPLAGLVLARNGVMYGTTVEGSIIGSGQGDGGVLYSYDPALGKFSGLVNFTTQTGVAPRAALIEGTDGFLYGTTSLNGGSNRRGTDDGTIVRLAPALRQ